MPIYSWNETELSSIFINYFCIIPFWYHPQIIRDSVRFLTNELFKGKSEFKHNKMLGTSNTDVAALFLQIQAISIMVYVVFETHNFHTQL
jgi:hypothetical protein